MQPEMKSKDAESEAKINLISISFRLFAEQKYLQAIRAFSAFIDKYEPTCLPYYFRGASYFYLNSFDLAITDLTMAIVLNSEHEQSYHIRGLCYYRKHLFRAAILDLNVAIKIEPSVDKYRNRAFCKFCNCDFSGAVADVECAYELAAPDDHQTLYLRAYLLCCLGRSYYRALKSIDEALFFSPKNKKYEELRNNILSKIYFDDLIDLPADKRELKGRKVKKTLPLLAWKPEIPVNP